MLKLITSALEVVSAVAITTGAAMVWSPLGFVVGGALGLWFAKAAA